MIFHELRFALRSQLRRPLPALTIVVTLALGIGVNTAIFTVNYTAPYASGFTGNRNFQHWFRDPAAATGSNTSDAITIAF